MSKLIHKLKCDTLADLRHAVDTFSELARQNKITELDDVCILNGGSPGQLSLALVEDHDDGEVSLGVRAAVE